MIRLALEVPLVLNVSRRVDAEVKAEAAAGAQLVAASAAAELGSGDARDLTRIADSAAEESGGSGSSGSGGGGSSGSGGGDSDD